MKQDIKNLAALKSEAARLSKLKYDMLVPATDLIFSCPGGIPTLKMEGNSYPMLERAQRHIAELIQMPFTYFARLRDNHPQLLAYDVNTLLSKCSSEKPRLVRTLGGRVRAIVSNKYKLLEHENVLDCIAPLFDEYRLDVASCSIDDDRMRIKLISRKNKVNATVGTTVCFGVMIQNSETSAAALSVIPFAMKLQCTNGLVLPEYFSSTRKIHRGTEILDLEEYVTPDMGYIFDHVAESIDSCLDSSNYRKVTEAIQRASALQLADPVKNIQAAAKELGLTTAEQGQALVHLLEGKDFTLMGLSDAITKTGEDASTYARATYLEEAGASVLFRPFKPKPVEETLFIAA